MKTLRVAIVCDYLEERWPSMDLIGDMLMQTLPSVSVGRVEAVQLRPQMNRRLSRLPLIGHNTRMQLADRLTARLWDYPHWLAPRVRDFDVFHVVDHSYAHVMRVLPPERTIVTCHDLDAMTAALNPAPATGVEALLAKSVLDGISRAAHVACNSETTRADLLGSGRVAPARTSVSYLGVHPSCRPGRTGAASTIDLLHVGSTIARKRIDVLLEVFAGLCQRLPNVRLVRAGGALTPEQQRLASQLGVFERIVQMPTLEREQLAELYRSASLVLLPSEREGFGLPLIEAMACGTPVVASGIPALREIGGDAAVYCAPGDVTDWVEVVARLLREKDADPDSWNVRRDVCVRHAARFDWKIYADQMSALYHQVARS